MRIRMILKLLVCIIVLAVGPFILGENVLTISKTDIKQENRISIIFKKYLLGWVLEFAVFQIIAVPMILLKTPFHILFIVWTLVMVVLLIPGLIFSIHKIKIEKDVSKQDKNGGRTSSISKIELTLSLLVLLGVIGFQLYQYGINTHIDLDDSRFVANTIEAVENDTMFQRSAATGEYLGYWTGEQEKDVTSPWMIMYATLTKLTGVSAATMVHTVMPVILLILAYFAIWLLGDELTEGDYQKNIYFVLFSALIFMISSGSSYTQGVFMLNRIWQGKATVAAFFIPLILYFFVKHFKKKDKVEFRSFLELIIINFAICLTTGVGLITAAVLTGGYGIWSAIAGKSWKNLIFSWVCEIPIIIYGLIQIMIVGGK